MREASTAATAQSAGKFHATATREPVTLAGYKRARFGITTMPSSVTVKRFLSASRS